MTSSSTRPVAYSDPYTRPCAFCGAGPWEVCTATSWGDDEHGPATVALTWTHAERNK